MWSTIYDKDTLLGVTIGPLESPVMTARGEGPFYLMTINDRYSPDTAEKAEMLTRREASENADTVRRVNRVLARTPITPEAPEKYKDHLVFKPSFLYGDVQLWLIYRVKGQPDAVFGTLYPLPDGTWLNQYRPHAFATKEEAAYDLLALCNPIEYEIVRG